MRGRIRSDGTESLPASRFELHRRKTAAWNELRIGRNAKVVSAIWQESGTWDGEAPPLATVPEIGVSDPKKTTVETAVSSFIAEHSQSSALNTQKKYGYVLNKLKAHSDSKGYVLIEQWGPVDVREFRASWQVSPLTGSKNMTVVKSFFEFAVINEWISRNPARLIKEKHGRNGGGPTAERIPFLDEELRRMFEACQNQYGKAAIRWSRQTHRHPAGFADKANYRYGATGQDLADFISVSVYTGLRISDVSTFHIDRLQPSGECHIRTMKNGRKVFTWIPEWLQERMRLRAAQSGPIIFGVHSTKDMNVITDVWRRKLKRLWDLCGPWPEKPTPHRFRHTFARILLQRDGVTVRDVAELLGDTEEMVRKHYSAWVPERQARLTKVLQDAFADKPTPHTPSGEI
jgi:integrase